MRPTVSTEHLDVPSIGTPRAWRSRLRLGTARSPSKTSLLLLTRRELQLARNSSSGRSARVVSGEGAPLLTHTLVALRAGECLEDEAGIDEGTWTAQILQGRARLVGGTTVCFGWPGDLIVGLASPHGLRADTDAAFLVTTVGSPDRLEGKTA
jgi:hypothetical protein